MMFPKEIINNFSSSINFNTLRLDEDEKNHSLYLITPQGFKSASWNDHIESRHIDPTISDSSLIPQLFYLKIETIFNQYTTGISKLINKQWVTEK